MEKERGGKPNLLQARLPGAEHRSRDSQERAQKEEQVTHTVFRKRATYDSTEIQQKSSPSKVWQKV